MTLYSPRTHATTTLGTMSTASLIDHILSRDYGKTILLFSDLDAAYSSLLISDDTFAELERRPDAASELQNRLNEITKNGYSEDDYETVTQIGLLRTLLSLPIYQQNLNLNGNTPLLTNSARSGLDSFTIGIVTYTQTAITSNLSGSWIYLYTADRDYTYAIHESLEQDLLDEYPSLTTIADGCAYYNCHSYAWYDASTSNPYWLKDPYYYVRDSHHSSRTYDTATVGDIVVYTNAAGDYTHSAIITNISTNWLGQRVITCQSKWGQTCIFEHKINYVHESYYEGLTEPEYQIIHRATGHTYTTFVSYNASGHTRKCKHCSATITESHTINSLGKCVCGYSGPGALNSLPPEDDQCCGS